MSRNSRCSFDENMFSLMMDDRSTLLMGGIDLFFQRGDT
jgi:hypothetical protein